MGLFTVEGTVENGQIRLSEGVTLPERATVYVVVPNVAAPPQPRSAARVVSPRLVHPERAADFTKQVIEAPVHAEQR
jgi:hypothetical protein